MTTHYFVDETKAKGYVIVAVACPASALGAARSTIDALVLPGQRTIHMKNESARRRAHIASAVCGLTDVGVSAVVLDAGRGPESEIVRRERALRAMVTLATAGSTAVNLTLDLDQTLRSRDARVLASSLRERRATGVTYGHQTLTTQPLLALPDVVAWCWARGGDWRRRVQSVISEKRDV